MAVVSWRRLRSFPMRLAATFRARRYRRGLGSAGRSAHRFLPAAGPSRRLPRRNGRLACIRWGLAGYTPQISQRRAQTSVPDGWHDPGKAWAGAQEEEQLWGSK